LRMSFTVSNLTQVVNTAGDIRVFSMDMPCKARGPLAPLLA
jgi:hypothetical protein